MPKGKCLEPDPIIAIGLLLGICLLFLTPFLNKSFHIDDPLFIWVAKHIQNNPFDFYGFTVNWYGVEMPMSEITKNPPFTSFYIAAVAFCFGWSEIALHVAFLVPACAVVIGTYCVAKELCDSPFLATLASMLTPVFLLSSTTIMCDIMMLAFWIWAVYFWLYGIKTESNISLGIASLLIAACCLTKYYGMSLIPLVFAYSLTEKRRLGRWMLFLLFPVLILVAYQWATHALYGRGLLLDAVSYSTTFRARMSAGFLTKALVGLAFIGGCLITILFYSPIFWRKWIVATGTLLILFLTFFLKHFTTVLNFQIFDNSNINWLFIIQFSILCCAGVCIIFIAIADIWRRRDADSLLLFLWLMGTFIFAIFLNWSINGRSILPAVPASGILLIRHLSRRKVDGHNKSYWHLLLPLVPALVIALLVTWADYRLANASRSAAIKIYNTFSSAPGTLWFQGHWGFQYYMETLGAKALDFERPAISAGDIIIIPLNNTNIRPMSKEWFVLIQEFQLSTDTVMATMNSAAGAGFYSDLWGPLPFAVEYQTNEKYYAFRMLK